jgi:hypothetical protein
MPKRSAPQPRTAPAAQLETPWDDYNAKTDSVDQLMGYDWEYVSDDGEKVFLKRPGQTDAAHSGNYSRRHNMFVCHSTSTPLEPEKGYDAVGIFAAYECAGDRSEAVKRLRKMGYGSKPQVQGKKIVAVVSRERTAQRMTGLLPRYVWRSLHPLGSVPLDLKGRKVVVYPALGEEAAWEEMTERMQRAGIAATISYMTQGIASDEDRAQGLDIADFIERAEALQPA